jgi:hypothetical protein
MYGQADKMKTEEGVGTTTVAYLNSVEVQVSDCTNISYAILYVTVHTII